ncbi:radical SAM family heme chaperone HemW [Acinetobacter qingfengensis]|uniref:Heme chaperone HemW n=1 Tax=Acinetobacter qingfengensis TaxID=1262585 RepID=A0A1E7R389_9GAMM|nr:radical SAM family heme chaperone HemW [Acinetobacter qingfengensis]KAA8733765.1 radical SAM family heme chaperone HemW [Acinetobacter qingfengensis]OEY93723.1 YggW family oxidoreductase [Acinetobacter qingfengensis]
MSYQPQNIPLSLYIHMPWCVRKCPYCDFNSHELAEGQLTQDLEQHYLHALVADLQSQQKFVQDRLIESVFIGGGTPSLISAQGYQWLFSQLQQLVPFRQNCEITMEANPGTLEHAPFADYLQAGINRLSIGVQSFNAEHLQILGRIHDTENARQAIYNAAQAGFKRINVDLMHGLPQQRVEQALYDLNTAIDLGATHISWYQLTIEPNTVFYRSQPTLPDEDVLEQIQQQGEQRLKQHGFFNYEISAWAKELPSQHNLNYWQFGDYLAIGAGAHGKVSLADGVYRFQKTRLPKDYLAKLPAEHVQFKKITDDEMPFEFMMNVLRLTEGAPKDYYTQRTHLSLQSLSGIVQSLQHKNLMQNDSQHFACTKLGRQYLNTVLENFL